MVALEGVYGAGERIGMMSDWESRVRSTELKLSVARPVI